MRLISHPRFLAVYSGVLTVVFAATVVLGIRNGGSIVYPVHAEESAKTATFDEITVERINVVEPDGTPRLVIADKEKFPGSFFKGREGSRADRSGVAGMLFMNDEGTENGGLIFGGYEGKDGVPHGFGHLSFDEYEQDQSMSLDTGQDGEERHAGIRISDNGTARITRGDGRVREGEGDAEKYAGAGGCGEEGDGGVDRKISDSGTSAGVSGEGFR